MMFKTVRGIENVNTNDLLIRGDGRTRAHGYKLKKTRCHEILLPK